MLWVSLFPDIGINILKDTKTKPQKILIPDRLPAFSSKLTFTRLIIFVVSTSLA